MKNILLVVAPVYFMDTEYDLCKNLFEKEGFNIITASRNVNLALGKLGSKISIDENIYDIDVNLYDSIIFIGGSGSLIYRSDKMVHNIILEFNNAKKPIGGICIAPLILAYSGILKNKKVTVWNLDQKYGDEINSNGGIFTNNYITIDDNIVTVNGPDSVDLLVKEIINMLN